MNVLSVVAARYYVVLLARSQRWLGPVLFYAVAVFVAFLCGLLAMAKFFRVERRRWRLTISLLGATAVATTLGADLARGDPIVSVIGALAIAGGLYRLWVKAGRPSGLAEAEKLAEASLDSDPGAR